MVKIALHLVRRLDFKYRCTGASALVLFASFFFLWIPLVSCLAQEGAESGKEYIISTDDVIDIGVFGEPDLSISTRVSREGTINYPLLGNIKVSGFTARQVESNIAKLLEKDYLVEPQVNVVIKEYSKISILGEVKNPGAYQMKERLTITQAIALAGGFTAEANLSNVQIMRYLDDKKENITADLDKILNKKAQDIEIKPRDTIIVGEYGNFSIMGQVVKPGIYKLKKNISVVDAIVLAGGFTATASPNGTKVIRIENNKEKKIFVVPVARIMKGEETAKDIILKPEDTIVVPESFF